MARVNNGDVSIYYEVTGEGRPVVLLHGWPDTGVCWRNQVPALADAGFKVIVPDLRGYGQSDKPDEVEAYSIFNLAGDVLAVLDDLGVARGHVVGHDWGAGVAWALGIFAQDRVDHLVALSVGCPGTFLRTLEQREKSWYMLLFQFEGLAEQWLSENDWANFRAWAAHPDADMVTKQLEADGSLTPGLNFYRANLPASSWVGSPTPFPKVTAPTMGIWSSGDMALTETQMTESTAGVDGTFRYERIDGVGHWLQLEAPDRFNELLIDFLAH
jgi:pimeloyl-ACP methyl ester carboxylesterase